MALIVEFICELPNGVHARPASHVETLCNTFSSQIEWHNLRTDRKGNAKSALALIGTDTLVGDNCQLLISGADEQEAHQRLSQWLRDEFPHCDAPLAEVKSDELEPLPVSLTNLNPRIIRARTVCSGSAGGILTPISSLDLNALGNLPAAKGVDAEQSALENGLTLDEYKEFAELQQGVLSQFEQRRELLFDGQPFDPLFSFQPVQEQASTPEPHSPRAGAPPMVVKDRPRSGSGETVSMAPSCPAMPQERVAPSKHGPAAAEQA